MILTLLLIKYLVVSMHIIKLHHPATMYIFCTLSHNLCHCFAEFKTAMCYITITQYSLLIIEIILKQQNNNTPIVK